MLVSLDIQKYYDSQNSLQRIFQCEKTLTVVEDYRDELIKIFLQSEKNSDFENKLGESEPSPVSFPKEPLFFKNEISVKLFEAQLSLLGENIEILSNSSAVTPNLSKTSSCKFQITQVRDNYTIGSYRMLLHEVGHYLYDKKIVKLSSNRSFFSEVTALKYEFKLLEKNLSKNQISEYLEYQKKWFLINTFAYNSEKNELIKKTCKNRPKILWALEWASAGIGYSKVMKTASKNVFSF